MTDRPDSRRTPDLRQAAAYFLRLLLLIRPYWTPLAQGMVLGVLAGLLATAIPYVTKLLIDRVYPAEDVTLMHLLVATLLVVSLASNGLGVLHGFFGFFVQSRLANATRLLFFNRLQHLPMRFFDDHQVGEINSRFLDVRRSVDTVSLLSEAVFVHGIHFLLVPPLLVLLEWRLALLALISLPVIMTVTVVTGHFQRRFWRSSSEAYADLDAYQVEVLSHIRTFKGMGLERRVFQSARRQVSKATAAELKAGGLAQVLMGISGSLRAMSTAAFTWFGWILILSQRMSLGDYFAFTFYISLLYQPLGRLVQVFAEVQHSAVHLSRMFEYLDLPAEQDPDLVESPPALIARPLTGAFRFEGVAFGYRPGRPVVRDVAFEIAAGSVTALVGPSGSGKTTLLRLFSALEVPDGGRILVDGRPLDELPLSEVRRQIAVVWQEIGLIRGTLWENLTLGLDREPALAEVDRIVALCDLEAVIAEQPAGYQTAVSEWGASLSAGQQQRVAIARALLRDTPILVLDEATANLDVETETRILDALFARRGDRTVIFVTHRLATAALADRIAVLEAGSLVGFGPHQQLLESCAIYRRMQDATRAAASFSRLRVVR